MLVLIRRFVELEWVERDGSVSGLSGRVVQTKLPLILKAAAVHLPSSVRAVAAVQVRDNPFRLRWALWSRGV